MIGWMSKNNRAARAARTSVQFFDVFCRTTARNLQVWCSNDNMNRGERGEQWILFSSNLNVSLDFVSGNIEILGKKIHCFPRDEALSHLFYSKTKQKHILKNALRFLRQHQATFNCTLWSRATAVIISWVTVNCFPFDVIVFAMLPAHGIWRETVSLLDVKWPWTSQWMGAL